MARTLERELPRGEGPAQLGALTEGPSHPHLLPGRPEGDPAAPVQPVGAGPQALGSPRAPPVELGHQEHQAALGRRDVGRLGAQLVLQLGVGEVPGNRIPGNGTAGNRTVGNRISTVHVFDATARV